MATIRDLRPLNELRLLKPTQPGRPDFISAASGLVERNRELFVIADDETSLARFQLPFTRPGQLIPLLKKDLPLPTKERKKVKPDFEALCHFSESGHSFLLALPSGSKRQRSTGCLVPLEDPNSPRALNFEGLFTHLSALSLGELNLEGIVILESTTLLFQRGNSFEGTNAVIFLRSADFIKEVLEGEVSDKSFHHIKKMDLGRKGTSSYSFTDACAWRQDQILFLAAAEDSPNTYDDGIFSGALLGWMDEQGTLLGQVELDISHKPEGICPHPDDPQNSFLIVTDADDFTRPSLLYEGTLCP